MNLSIHFPCAAVCGYFGGSIGFVLGESLVYLDGRVTDGAGVPIAVWQRLPELSRVPFTNAGFALFLGMYACLAASLALWLSRRSWFRSVRFLGILILSTVAGFSFGVACCVLLWLLFGGWGPPAPLLFIGAAIAAVFSACVLSRYSRMPALPVV
jgi:hypothetical protein